jgi:membrane protease YdiL (CAAX protease family)
MRVHLVTGEAGSDAHEQPPSLVLVTAWLLAATVAAGVVPVVIGASLPLLTFVWLAIAAVVLRRRRSAAALGLARPPRHELAQVTAVATVAMTLLFGIAEIVTHPYRDLLELVREESTPDSTFAWVVEYGRGWGLVGFAVYGGLVTIFAEEIVFRGALMTRLRQRGRTVAVGGTTVAFAAVQALPAALLSARAAVGFLVIDAVLAVGVVGGLAAYRTRSILPALVAITVANVVVLAAVT